MLGRKFYFRSGNAAGGEREGYVHVCDSLLQFVRFLEKVAH